MTIDITCKCPFCGKVSTITCYKDAWDEYKQGALIQDVFFDMDKHSRETLISGLCFSCQESFYQMIEEDWDDDDDDDDPCDGICDLCPEGDTCPWSDLLSE